MNLLGISFAANEADDPYPERITVEMSKDEALLIAVMVGKLNGAKVDELIPGMSATETHSDIYDCLTGSVFNRYWEDGVKDALRER